MKEHTELLPFGESNEGGTDERGSGLCQEEWKNKHIFPPQSVEHAKIQFCAPSTRVVIAKRANCIKHIITAHLDESNNVIVDALMFYSQRYADKVVETMRVCFYKLAILLSAKGKKNNFLISFSNRHKDQEECRKYTSYLARLGFILKETTEVCYMQSPIKRFLREIPYGLTSSTGDLLGGSKLKIQTERFKAGIEGTKKTPAERRTASVIKNMQILTDSLKKSPVL